VLEITARLTANAEDEICGESPLGLALVFNVAGQVCRKLEVLAAPKSPACRVGELEFFRSVRFDPAFVVGD